MIPECKETQLIRFQSRVVGLTTPARRHSMKIINLCKSHNKNNSFDEKSDESTKIPSKCWIARLTFKVPTKKSSPVKAMCVCVALSFAA